ncbi:hypothetical protein DCCM_4385 [Desulfocucumis palustris]|uniref:Uncharacterized protein n=1 Tax=Desulfocucumis palustris TaxID=1898651 RepID=A0A2L2XGJ2_9FIRM|nr:hypothetical protein DCCM_4385 [Desulfocucumis palustris]
MLIAAPVNGLMHCAGAHFYKRRLYRVIVVLCITTFLMLRGIER